MTFHNTILINKCDLNNIKVIIFFGPKQSVYLYGIDKSYHITIALIINNLSVILINILRQSHPVGFPFLFSKENKLCH